MREPARESCAPRSRICRDLSRDLSRLLKAATSLSCLEKMLFCRRNLSHGEKVRVRCCRSGVAQVSPTVANCRQGKFGPNALACFDDSESVACRHCRQSTHASWLSWPRPPRPTVPSGIGRCSLPAPSRRLRVFPRRQSRRRPNRLRVPDRSASPRS